MPTFYIPARQLPLTLLSAMPKQCSLQPTKPAHGSVILGTPFARISQLVILFISLKSLVSAISQKSIANFEFNFSNRDKNLMLDPSFCFNIIFAPRSLVYAISCELLML
jgi:hypothetical protein